MKRARAAWAPRARPALWYRSAAVGLLVLSQLEEPGTDATLVAGRKLLEGCAHAPIALFLLLPHHPRAHFEDLHLFAAGDVEENADLLVLLERLPDFEADAARRDVHARA